MKREKGSLNFFSWVFFFVCVVDEFFAAFLRRPLKFLTIFVSLYPFRWRRLRGHLTLFPSFVFVVGREGGPSNLFFHLLCYATPLKGGGDV